MTIRSIDMGQVKQKSSFKGRFEITEFKKWGVFILIGALASVQGKAAPMGLSHSNLDIPEVLRSASSSEDLESRLLRSCAVTLRLRMLNMEPPTTQEQEADLNTGSEREQCFASVHFESENIPGVTIPFVREQNKIAIAELSQKRVISLGEGNGGVVPYLFMRGLDAYGIDIAQSYQQQMGTLFSAFPGRLIYGDALRYASMPLSRKMYDHQISSLLFCDLDYDMTKQVLLEGLSVLKPGGSSRHIFSHGEAMVPQSQTYKEMLRQVQLEATRRGMRLAIHSTRILVKFPSEHNDRVFQGLFIDKLQ